MEIHRQSLLALAIAAGSVLAAVSPALADVVRLKNGKSLEGDAVEANGQVSIRSAVGTISVPASMVVTIERGPSFEEQAAERLQTLRPDDVEGRVELAFELADSGARTLAQRIFAEVLERDPDHPAAREALGYVLCDEEWLTMEACHRRQGDVLHDGRWVSLEERSVLQSLEHERRRNEIERLRIEMVAESARLDAERQAAAQGYSAQLDPFGYGVDSGYYYGYYGGGVPYWPAYSVVGTPLYPFHSGRSTGDGRFGHDRRSHGGLGGSHPGRGPDRGARAADRGGVHRQGGQPPRPLAPSTNRSSMQRPATPAARPGSR